MASRNPLAAKGKLKSIVAPVKGWNARDAISEMEKEEALYLDNMIPDTKGVRLRRGVRTHVSGITGNFVESLMEYNVAGASPKMFAAGPNNIFDVSSSGAVGAAVVTSLSSGRWQHTMFATAGGNFLVACNGVDDVINYDGSTWTEPAITGVTPSTLINVCAHVQRLFFVRTGTLKYYYLAALSIAGAASEVDLAPLCKHGGELIAMASWSRDGGSGLDDYAVFATSKGEILVYQGTDPSSVNTWGLVGVFKAPEPIGRRCFIKLGADLCYLSSQGVLPLPQFLGKSSAGVSDIAVTDTISGAFKQAYADGATLFGWQVIEYPKENLLICNVPIAERSRQQQYVMNLKTGAWARWKDINAGCWAIKGDQLFCGGNDGIVRVYGGTSNVYDDDGEPITALGVQAFSDFGTPMQKHFTMARPWMTVPQSYVAQVKMLVDFDESLPTFDPISFEEIGPEWDVAEWDVAEWGSGSDATAFWQSVTGTSAVGAVAVAVQSTAQIVWNRTDIVYEPGGVL
jgi:hypothetical protein